MSECSLKKRPLLISPDFAPPLIGGSVVYLYNLVKYSKSQFTVLTSALINNCGDIDLNNAKILRKKWLTPSLSPTKTKLAVMYASLILWAVVHSLFHPKKHPVIMLNISVIGNSLLVSIFSFFRIPSVVFAYAEEITTALYGQCWKSCIKRSLLKIGYKRATHFIAVCDFASNKLKDLGISADKITVIVPSLSGDKFREKVMTHMNHDKTILSAGRFIERKGFHYLIDAFALVKRELDQAKLICVGNGPQQEELIQMVKDRHLENCVQICLAVGDKELSHLYGMCNLFVLANVMLKNGDCEGCPTVLIEASAHGKPVIAGREGGAANAIDHEKTGYLIDPTDTKNLCAMMLSVLNDPKLARRLGEAGREKVLSQHNPKLTAGVFDTVLSPLVGK